MKATLVEPRTKRVAFLRSVTGQLSAGGLTVLRCRSDAVSAKSFDVAYARATLGPEPWLLEGLRLARRAVWVLLAKEGPPQHPTAQIQVDQSYVWPHTGVKRRVVRYLAP